MSNNATAHEGRSNPPSGGEPKIKTGPVQYVLAAWLNLGKKKGKEGRFETSWPRNWWKIRTNGAGALNRPTSNVLSFAKHTIPEKDARVASK